MFLMEKPEDIMRKFKRAVTDSDTERCVRYDPEHKPGVSNLMSIYSAVTGRSFEAIEREFDGKGYGAFKPVVGEAVVEMLRPIREETERLLADKAYLESVYRAGAEKASYVANKTLRKVYKRWASWPANRRANEIHAIGMKLNYPDGHGGGRPGGGAVGGPSATPVVKNLAFGWGRWMCPRTAAGCTNPIPAWAGWPSSWAFPQRFCFSWRSDPQIQGHAAGARSSSWSWAFWTTSTPWGPTSSCWYRSSLPWWRCWAAT